jgi:argininosuccinate lyase
MHGRPQPEFRREGSRSPPASFAEDDLAKGKLWGGRFSSETDALFAEFNDSLRFDRELLAADVEASLAYCRALQRAGVFSRNEMTQVERALKDILAQHLKNPTLVAQSGAEDIHTYVEETLTKRVGALALKLHTGRSRNDQVATDLRLYLRQREDQIGDEINRLLKVIADLAEKHLMVPCPGYTHLQRAQPVLFSHYLLSFAEMFLRDRERLMEFRARANVCPLGSGALSGTVYAVDRNAIASELGFASVSGNSMDAVSDRDFVLDFLYFASVLMMHLSRLAEDLILYCGAEFGFVQMHDSVSSGSSLMPQKKNPDALELIRAKAGRTFGHLMTLLSVLKGLPMTYNKDLQEDKEGLFDAIRTVDLCLRMARRVLEKMQVRPERMLDAVQSGYLNATELADYLVSKQMPFRAAHHLVGKIVVRAIDLGLQLNDLPLVEFRSFSPLFAQDLYGWLKPVRAISRRTEPGGTSPRAVRRALKILRKKIETPN